MNTKQKILNEALTLFSEKGYSAVYVADIAEAVGIKAPSLYKHFKSKREIFNAILEEIKQGYDKRAADLQMNGNDAGKDAELFSTVSEETLVQMGKELFLYFLHDDKVSKFRKMLTLEQFQNSELAVLYSRQYVDEPLSYQASMFDLISASGLLAQMDTTAMALHFYAPIYLMLTVCDREPEREKEALLLIEQHIRQFNKLYGREETQ